MMIIDLPVLGDPRICISKIFLDCDILYGRLNVCDACMCDKMKNMLMLLSRHTI